MKSSFEMLLFIMLIYLSLPLYILTNEYNKLIEFTLDVPHGSNCIMWLNINDKYHKLRLDIVNDVSIFESDRIIRDDNDIISDTFINENPSQPTPLPFFTISPETTFHLYSGVITFTSDECTCPFSFAIPSENVTLDDIYSALALPYKFKDDKYSLVHQLYNNGQIERKQFMAEFIIDEDENYFFIGGMPDRLKEDKVNTTLYVDNNYNEWGFDVHAIKYNNNQTLTLNKQHAYLVTYDEDIFVDENTFNWILYTAFKEYHDNNTCGFCTLRSRDSICCDEETFKYISPFQFVIQGYVFEFNRKEMFFCDGKKCHLNIEKNDKQYCDDNPHWKIGYSFFTRFYTLFDYDNGSITFYGSKNVTYTGEGVISKQLPQHKSLLIKVVLTIVISIMLVSICIIIIFHIIFKHNKI